MADWLEDFFAPADQEKADRFAYEQEVSKRRTQNSLRRAENEIRQMEATLKARGIEPPEQKDREGFLYTLTDTLDALGQGVRGTLGYVLGSDQITSDNIFSAWSEGQEKDLTVGEMLRENPWFAEHDIARGLAGFVGDVATDPLTYLSFGTAGLGKQIGGRAINAATKFRGAGGLLEDAGQIYARNLSDTLMSTTTQVVKDKAKTLNKYDALFTKEGKAVDESAENLLKQIAADGDITKLAERLDPEKALSWEEFQKVVSVKQTEAGKEVSDVFTQIAALSDQRKSMTRSGALEKLKKTGEVDPGGYERKAQEISSRLGLTSTESGKGIDFSDLEEIFNKKGIRGTSILAGMGQGKIPFLTASDFEIPLITKGSEQLFDKIGGAGVGAYYNITNKVDKIYEANKDNPLVTKPIDTIRSIGDFLDDKIIQTGMGVAKKLSHRVALTNKLTGSGIAKKQLTDHLAQKNFLAYKSMSEVNDRFAEFLDTPELLDEAGRVLQAGIKDYKGKSGAIAGSARELVEDKEAFEFALKEMTRANAEKIGNDKAMRLESLVRMFKDDMDMMAQKEIEAGVSLGGILESYVHMQYDDAAKGTFKQVKDAETLANARKFKKLLNDDMLEGSAKPFNFQRVFRSFDEAESLGLKANTNIAQMWGSRKYLHERALAEKDFYERFAYAHGLPKKTLENLRTLSVSNDLAKRRVARDTLKSMGYKLDLSDMINPINKTAAKNFAAETTNADAARFAKQIAKTDTPLLDEMGQVMSLDRYDSIVTRAKNGDKGALAEINQFGIKGHKNANAMEVERIRLQELAGDPTQLRRMASGQVMTAKDYDRIASRIRSASPEIRALAEQEAKTFKLGGLLKGDNELIAAERQAIAQAGDIWESQQIGKGLLHRDGNFGASSAGAGVVEAGYWNKIKPQGIDKKIWDEDKDFWTGLLPTGVARHIEDSIDSAGLIGDHVKKLMRENRDPDADVFLKVSKMVLPWMRALKMGTTTIFPAFHARNLVSGQIQGVGATSLLGEALNVGRVFNNYALIKHGKPIITDTGERLTREKLIGEASSLGLSVRHDDMLDIIKAKGTWLDEVADDVVTYKSEVERLKREAQKASSKNPFRMASNKIESFSETVESAGRMNLYINLRRKGFDPSSAASKTNEIMIDYARGKTPFERNVMNNALFFYSFARGNTSNMVKQLWERPGALTAQLHTFRGVGEMLTDPNQMLEIPDYDKKYLSRRQKDQLTRVIGTTEGGMPKLFSGMGLPLEQLSQFFAVEMPQEITAGEFFDVTMDNAKKLGKQGISMLNPVIKTPIELLANKDFFFDKPLTDKTINKIAGFERDLGILGDLPAKAIPNEVWNSLDDAFRSFLKGTKNKDGTFTADPTRYAIAKLIPGVSRTLSTRAQMTNLELSQGERLARGIYGAKISGVDPGKSMTFDYHRTLEDLLARTEK